MVVSITPTLQTRSAHQLEPLERIQPVDPLLPTPPTRRLGRARRHRHALFAVRRPPRRGRRTRYGRIVQIKTRARRLPSDGQADLGRPEYARHRRDSQTLGNWRGRRPAPCSSLGMDPQVAQLLIQRRSAPAVLGMFVPTGNRHRPGCNPRRGRQPPRRMRRVRGIPRMLLLIHHMQAKIAERNRLRQRLVVAVRGPGRAFVPDRGRPTKSGVGIRHRRSARSPPGYRPSSRIVRLGRESAEKVGHDDPRRGLMKSRKKEGMSSGLRWFRTLAAWVTQIYLLCESTHRQTLAAERTKRLVEFRER